MGVLGVFYFRDFFKKGQDFVLAIVNTRIPSFLFDFPSLHDLFEFFMLVLEFYD